MYAKTQTNMDNCKMAYVDVGRGDHNWVSRAMFDELEKKHAEIVSTISSLRAKLAPVIVSEMSENENGAAKNPERESSEIVERLSGAINSADGILSMIRCLEKDIRF